MGYPDEGCWSWWIVDSGDERLRMTVDTHMTVELIGKDEDSMVQNLIGYDRI